MKVDLDFKRIGLFASIGCSVLAVGFFVYLFLVFGFDGMLDGFLGIFYSNIVLVLVLVVLFLVFVIFYVDRLDVKKYSPRQGDVNFDEGRSLIGSVLFFMLHPRADVKLLDKGVKGKFWDVSRLVGISIFLSLFVSLIGSWVLAVLDVNVGGNKNSVVVGQNLYWYVFLAVVFAPTFEEVVFRSCLRYGPFRLSLFVSFVYISFLFQFVSIDTGLEFVALYGMVLVLFVGLGLVFKFFVPLGFGRSLYGRYFFVLFYCVALLFGFIHMFNFFNWMNILVLIPLLVLPQIIGGFLLGYVRLFYGLSWSVLFHAFFNGFLALYTVVFLGFSLSGFFDLGLGSFLLYLLGFVFVGLLSIYLFVGFIFSLIEFVLGLGFVRRRFGGKGFFNR